MKIKPLFDYVLIEPSDEETKTASGIVLPDSAKEKPQRGTVVAVGPGRIDSDGTVGAVAVKVGDKVIYKKWGGNEIKVEGKEMLLVKEEDLMGTVTD